MTIEEVQQLEFEEFVKAIDDIAATGSNLYFDIGVNKIVTTINNHNMRIVITDEEIDTSEAAQCSANYMLKITALAKVIMHVTNEINISNVRMQLSTVADEYTIRVAQNLKLLAVTAVVNGVLMQPKIKEVDGIKSLDFN